jgi:hypothetical protein
MARDVRRNRRQCVFCAFSSLLGFHSRGCPQRCVRRGFLSPMSWRNASPPLMLLISSPSSKGRSPSMILWHTGNAGPRLGRPVTRHSASCISPSPGHIHQRRTGRNDRSSHTARLAASLSW